MALFFKLLIIMKVKPEALMDEPCTRTSYFVRFLLKLCFFPIYFKGEKVRFSFLSCKTLVHLAMSIGVFSSIYILGMCASGSFEYAQKELLRVILDKDVLNFTLLILSAITSGTFQHNLGNVVPHPEYWPSFMLKGLF